MSVSVSVIIPAYNTEQYISKAILSALNQTLRNIEVIVVDDCSTDNTVEVVQSFNDPRLKLLLNKENLGAGGARNRAIESAQGEWIAVLDSDDWYAPQRLEVLVNIAEREKVDFIADDSYLIEDGDSTPWSTIICESGIEISSIQQFNAAEFILTDIEGRSGLRLGFTKPLFSRQFLQINNIKYENIKVTQDFWFDMQCFLHGAKFLLLPEPYYYYRARPGSLVSSNKIARMEEECEAIARFYQHSDYLARHPEVMAALKLKMKETRGWLDYYLVVEPLKQGEILVSLQRILSKPAIIRHSIYNLPRLIVRRWEKLLAKDRVNFQKNIFKARSNF